MRYSALGTRVGVADIRRRDVGGYLNVFTKIPKNFYTPLFCEPLMTTRLLLTVLFFVASTAVSQDGVQERRAAFPVDPQAKIMVEKILLPQGTLTNAEVIDVMKRVPRKKFVPPTQDTVAYWDRAIPIGNAQTISPPSIVAFMTEQLQPKPTDKVLEIGTGSGYQAAVLSLLVDQVYTVEIVEPLGKQAESLLAEMKMGNVHVKVGDGYKGWPEAAPFDGIIVTCSPESVPQPLIDQLKEGGRMLIPLGERFQQAFYLYTKTNGIMQKKRLTQALFVPMTGEAEDKRAVKPDPAHPTLVNGEFDETNEDGTPAGWHFVRNAEVVKTGGLGDGKGYVKFVGQFDPTAMPSPDQILEERSAMMLQGFAVDGKTVNALRLTYLVRGRSIKPMTNRFFTPTVVLWFYDENRNQISERLYGTVNGTFDWQYFNINVPVPEKACDGIILIGIPNSAGEADFDRIKLENR